MSKKRENQKRAARLLHHRAKTLKKGEPLMPPLIQASTFHLPGEPDTDFQYGRFDAPNWVALEKQLEILEDAPSVAHPSGMAAIAAVFFATLKKGDRVVIPSDGYKATRVLGEDFLKGFGVEVIEHPTPDFENAPMDGAKLVFVETPSNPGLDVCDLRNVIEKAHATGAFVAVDNSTSTPFLQRPLDLGADIIVAADTKAPNGHADVVLGHLATRNSKIYEAVREWRKISGSIPGPLDAWLAYRGLETLEVRLSRMCENAGVIAERLQDHPSVNKVRYPGLKDDPAFEIASRQMEGFGFLIGMTLKDDETAEKFLSACPVIAETTSFGSVHTSGERRARWGDNVEDGFVRLSVGCEPLKVLWQEIEAALSQI